MSNVSFICCFVNTSLHWEGFFFGGGGGGGGFFTFVMAYFQ